MREYELEIIIDTCNLNVNIGTSAELDCHAVIHFSDDNNYEGVQCNNNKE